MTQDIKLDFSIDRGGTFTDIFCRVSGHGSETDSIVLKLLSEDAKYGEGPREGIRRILEQVLQIQIPLGSRIPCQNIRSVRMGTTVATNALLERKGVKTALVVTKGFKDLLQIGNQSRPNIFDLEVKKSEVLYSAVLEIDERIRILKQNEDYIKLDDVHDGLLCEKVQVLKKPDPDIVEKQLKLLQDQGIQALSIVFMHSPSFPDHEILLSKIAQKLGFKQISLSSQIMPMIKILPRGSTSTIDAYLNPFSTPLKQFIYFSYLNQKYFIKQMVMP